jgi:hypothetical protein
VKPAPTETEAPEPIVAALPPASDPGPDPVEYSALDCEGEMLSILRKIARRGLSEAARVAAAKEVLARGDRERERGQIGKKALRQVAAEARIASGDKYAVPPPPPGMMRGSDRAQ